MARRGRARAGSPSRSERGGPCARRGTGGIDKAATWAASLTAARFQSTADFRGFGSVAPGFVVALRRRRRSLLRMAARGWRRGHRGLHVALELGEGVAQRRLGG